MAGHSPLLPLLPIQHEDTFASHSKLPLGICSARKAPRPYRPVARAKKVRATLRDHRGQSLVSICTARGLNNVRVDCVDSLLQCTVLAAGVIGAFSWSNVPQSYWLASALWYCSLLLSITGLLLSRQQDSVLDLLGAPQRQQDQRAACAEADRYLPLLLTEAHDTENGAERVRPKRKMVFLWQCSMMLMSYSATFYLVGLTVFVCSPLIQGRRDGPDSNVSSRSSLFITSPSLWRCWAS